MAYLKPILLILQQSRITMCIFLSTQTTISDPFALIVTARNFVNVCTNCMQSDRVDTESEAYIYWIVYEIVYPLRFTFFCEG